MTSNFKRLGQYISEVSLKNSNLEVDLLLGVSITKKFIPSIANTIGTDMSKYKVVRKNQFGYGPVTSRNGDKISVALLKEEQCIISTSYRVFEVIDHEALDPEYLMMWFRRPEFDRYARFMSHGSTREVFDWDEMCEVELPVPSIEKQRAIVKEYQAVTNRIKLNEQINQKLEETAQAIYKHKCIKEFQKEGDQTYLDHLIEFAPKHTIKKGNVSSYVEMASLQERRMSLNNVIKRPYSAGSKFANGDTLFARITPCLENGKTAFVDCLESGEVGFGSTEFIVLRAKPGVSPFWVYLLARSENFRQYAISSMIGSSGRQRVHVDYLREFRVTSLEASEMEVFNESMRPIFTHVREKNKENDILRSLKSALLSMMTSV